MREKIKSHRINIAISVTTLVILVISGYISFNEDSKHTLPNYSIVFNQNKVMRIDIKIEKDNWEKMQSNLDSAYQGEGGMTFRQAPEHPNPPKNRKPAQGDTLHEHRMPMHHMGIKNDTIGNHRPAFKAKKEGKPGRNDRELPSVDPQWVECSINFENKEWKHVGIRYKGNSSLIAAHHSKSKKYSFKLDFDEFEDIYPETKNQRFFGFKQLNLNNNYKDPSLLHEKVASDLFRNFGIAAAHTAFYAVYIHIDNQIQLAGIYTLVEEIDDTVLKTQFTNSKGNLYKPNGQAATFAAGTFNREQMNLKTNKKEADYKDIQQLYTILNSDLRKKDLAKWKSQLENIFDVDCFLKWLASTKVMQNWDAYGQSTRNYYLYNNPETGLLTWIPWDNNEALSTNHREEEMDLNQTQQQNNWPLIAYILQQEEFKEMYKDDIRQFTNKVFTQKAMTDTYNKYKLMLDPYIDIEINNSFCITNKERFESEIEYLKEHVASRNKAVGAYLNREN
jgi:spore coat protein CotH